LVAMLVGNLHFLGFLRRKKGRSMNAALCPAAPTSHETLPTRSGID
jgi:hypothetical protein